jgi:hypothetical protein
MVSYMAASVPVFRLFPGLVTFLAVPPIARLNHLLVAAFTSTGGIRNILVLDADNGGTSGEVVRRIVRTEIRFTHFLESLHLVAIQRHIT